MTFHFSEKAFQFDKTNEILAQLSTYVTHSISSQWRLLGGFLEGFH